MFSINNLGNIPNKLNFEWNEYSFYFWVWKLFIFNNQIVETLLLTLELLESFEN